MNSFKSTKKQQVSKKYFVATIIQGRKLLSISGNYSREESIQVAVDSAESYVPESGDKLIFFVFFSRSHGRQGQPPGIQQSVNQGGERNSSNYNNNRTNSLPRHVSMMASSMRQQQPNQQVHMTMSYF